MTAKIAKGDLFGQDDIKFKTIDGAPEGHDLDYKPKKYFS